MTDLAPDDLTGFTVALDPATQLLQGGTVVMGGSPLRVMRLTTAGADLVRRLASGEPVPPGETATTLTRRLLDGGLVHPDGLASPLPTSEVTVVVPVLGALDPALGRALLDMARRSCVVVVDDASPVPVEAPGPGIEVLRRAHRGGPAAARNTGLAVVETAVTAFLDADCRPDAGWFEPLLAHFTDARVAAVAPRVRVPAEAGTVLDRYDKASSSLDLGGAPGRVRARTRVSYVPAAALVVRTDALRSVGGFDEGLSVGEDVDLVWRLDEVGWTVRYEPGVTVEHPTRRGLGAWARRRFDYGTSAGPLAVRHPGALVPVEGSAWSLGVWALLASGHRIASAATAAISVDLLARGLASLDEPFPVAAKLAGQAHLRTGRMLADATIRPLWPVALGAAVASRRARRVVVLTAVVPHLVDWVRQRPSLDPVRWVGLGLADDVAYGTGVWVGAWRARNRDPLVPEVVRFARPGRYARWRTSLSPR